MKTGVIFLWLSLTLSVRTVVRHHFGDVLRFVDPSFAAAWLSSAEIS